MFMQDIFPEIDAFFIKRDECGYLVQELGSFHRKHFISAEWIIFFHNIFCIPDIRFELFEFFFKYGLLLFKSCCGLFKFLKEVIDG